MKRSLTLGLYGSIGALWLPTLEPFPKSDIGTLYWLLQLQHLPWIVKGVPLIPQNQNKQLLAIPINDQSKPVQFSMDQLHHCKQVKSLFLCDNAKLNIQPTNKSCLIALAHKQYLDAVHLCKFTIFRPNKLLYQIQSNQYFLYLAKHQYPVYNYNRNNWSRPSPPEFHS